jgi:hypothetical protein
MSLRWCGFHFAFAMGCGDKPALASRNATDRMDKAGGIASSVTIGAAYRQNRDMAR